MFEFNYDINLSRALRNAVNEKQNLSLDKTDVDKKIKGTYFAWDRICSIMDRIEDTINYVNSMKLGKQNGRSAFDFYEFITCSSVLIDCIRKIGYIFNIEPSIFEEIESSQAIFGNKYGTNGTDQKFFEYVRSLCVLHPSCTNRQKEYLCGSKFHCCPYVIWSEKMPILDKNDGRDLTAYIYTSKKDGHTIRLPLYVNQFKEYLAEWINSIPKVIDAIKAYNEDVYENFRKEKVKSLNNFNNVKEYLLYLKEEYRKRFGDDQSDIFDEYIRLFEIKLTNPQNQEKLEKYKNAIIYSVNFLQSAMQKMCFDGFDNTGIKYPDPSIETHLFFELCYIYSCESVFSKFSYNLEKVYYLNPQGPYHYYDKLYARQLLEEVKPIINQFVLFNNNESDVETLILVHLAQYLDALNHKNLLNANIPNEKIYREKIISEQEWTDLFENEESPTSQSEGVSLEELLKLYGQ